MANNQSVIKPGEYIFLGASFSSHQERKCDRCNYPIKYFYAVQEQTTGKKLVVGSECVKVLTGKTVSEHTKEMKEAEKRQAIIDQERARMQEIESFKSQHKNKFDYFFRLVEHCRKNQIRHEFIESLNDYYSKFDTLSIRQLEAVCKITTNTLDNIKNQEAVKGEVMAMILDLSYCSLGRWDKDFYNSLAQQFEQKSYLSDRQVECLRKMHSKYTRQIQARKAEAENLARTAAERDARDYLEDVKQWAIQFWKNSLKNQEEDRIDWPAWYQYWYWIRQMTYGANKYKEAVNLLRYRKKPFVNSKGNVETPIFLWNMITNGEKNGSDNIDALNLVTRGKVITNRNGAGFTNQASTYSTPEIANMIGMSGPAVSVKCAVCRNRVTLTLLNLAGQFRKNIAVFTSRYYRENQNEEPKAYFICDRCKDHYSKPGAGQ